MTFEFKNTSTLKFNQNKYDIHGFFFDKNVKNLIYFEVC